MKPTKALSDVHDVYNLGSDCAIQELIDHHLHQFVFGYGSLINGYSRSLTSPEQAHKISTPVLVRGLQRLWSVPMAKSSGMATGVQLSSNSECVGVLMPASAQELAAFDEREVGYYRMQISLEQIDLVPFLKEEEHYSHEAHRIVVDAMKSKYIPLLREDGQPREDPALSVRVWVYIPRFKAPPSPMYPIVQSYVDTILQGCLDISEDFAKAFLLTTRGWNSSDESFGEWDSDSIKDAANGTTMVKEMVFWVNDRHDPIYPRGDQVWSRENASRVDALMRKYLPSETFAMRKKSGPRLLQELPASQQ